MRVLILAALSVVLAPGAEWRPLFNGKDLAGWKMAGLTLPAASANSRPTDHRSGRP